MELRPYQQDFKSGVYDVFRSGKQSVLGQLATGGGKTIIFNSIIRDGFDSGRHCLILAHRGELIQQAAEKLMKGHNICSGIIKAGYTPRPYEQVQIASVQTLVNRKLFRPPHICIIDECHHMQKKNSYGDIKNHILELNPNCKFLGVSATPCRTNGAGFTGVFEELIQGISIPELIKQGFLAPPRYFVATLDMTGIKISAGDYNLKELSEEFQKKVHAADLVDNWLKLAKGLKTIGFAVDIEHSKTIIREFQKNNIPSAHIDGTTDELIRKRTIADFKSGRIQVLYNVGVFDEGFDLPEIECVQLARPSKSLIKYMQMIGRALRPAPGKEYAIVLDHSGLVAEHDLIEREREWTLEGVKKKESNTELMFKDKLTGKVYKPEKLPFELPMERIELVELSKETHKSLKLQKIAVEYAGLKEFQEFKHYKILWIWYQMARSVKKTRNIDKMITELTDKALVFCEMSGYNKGYGSFLVDDYINQNIIKKTA